MRARVIRVARVPQYHLDFENMEITLDWQFEWPLLYNNGTLTEIKRNDVFVQDGGGVSYSDRHSLFYVSFTYLNSTSPEGKFGYIFEVNNDGSVRSKLEVPRVLWESLLSGMYRAVPYDSIFGESNANPFNATASDVDDMADDLSSLANQTTHANQTSRANRTSHHRHSSSEDDEANPNNDDARGGNGGQTATDDGANSNPNQNTDDAQNGGAAQIPLTDDGANGNADNAPAHHRRR